MIVLDASATVEMLLGTPTGHAVRRRVVSHQVNAPHLLAVEVTQALRRLASSGVVAEELAGFCLRDFGALLIRRWRHEPFLARAWELRANVTVYDAMYLALAEGLEVPLVTTDARLARSGGHAASVEIPSD
jgi:predicted nucleic acid-binding protein